MGYKELLLLFKATCTQFQTIKVEWTQSKHREKSCNFFNPCLGWTTWG